MSICDLFQLMAGICIIKYDILLIMFIIVGFKLLEIDLIYRYLQNYQSEFHTGISRILIDLNSETTIKTSKLLKQVISALVMDLKCIARRFIVKSREKYDLPHFHEQYKSKTIEDRILKQKPKVLHMHRLHLSSFESDQPIVVNVRLIQMGVKYFFLIHFFLDTGIHQIF